jgi:hypothetical protein
MYVTCVEKWRLADITRRGIYILGIMFYKFGLEFFNGSITTLASDRFKAASTFTKRVSYQPQTLYE